MAREAQAIRSPETEFWHIQPLCPDHPRQGLTRGLRELGPADSICSWCASYGSGSDELDDRAGAVLRMLLRNSEAQEAHIVAQRVIWAFGDPVFVFWKADEQVTRRVPRMMLRVLDSTTLADSIARSFGSASQQRI